MMLPALSGLYLVTGSRWVLGLGICLGLPTLFPLGSVLTGLSPHAELELWPTWFRLIHFSVKPLPTLGIFAFCLLRAYRPGRIEVGGSR
jgi:hypothetical protein